MASKTGSEIALPHYAQKTGLDVVAIVGRERSTLRKAGMPPGRHHVLVQSQPEPRFMPGCGDVIFGDDLVMRRWPYHAGMTPRHG
jgi:hypothetical protein